MPHVVSLIFIVKVNANKTPAKALTIPAAKEMNTRRTFVKKETKNPFIGSLEGYAILQYQKLLTPWVKEETISKVRCSTKLKLPTVGGNTTKTLSNA